MQIATTALAVDVTFDGTSFSGWEMEVVAVKEATRH